MFPDPSAFVRRNELGPTSLSALRHLLTEVRRRGYATEEDEITTGFSSVAAAVLDHSAHPIAGVAVTFPGAQVDEEQRERMAAEVGRVARELTRRVGGVTD